ncbi:hypothetical protein A2Y99_04585 [Candidatus Gottesmanbacteria bacterium RBG_13_37_7]|uniref:Secondary thiamine-phosphate synthase enzyme n=1 Tax=Candidatus Gottesmanbacteria bacterium RBG_13_37_7 TaxID=1798369 RepID=A0A1F5YGB1_9BACT|nr:MAG: hypothetical protein A2Y99_04585 [Candidatus Gottesmanbacteria bacterium RBG_13_37_7]
MDLFYQTKGWTDIIDITNDINRLIENKKILKGLVNVFVKGSTAAITTIEADDNLFEDFKNILNNIIPMDRDWLHHQTWGDDNGGSHLRASLIGQDVNIPVRNGNLVLGTWQKIVLIDFDTSPRKREVIITLVSG